MQTVALFKADHTIKWPDRGSAERSLCSRDGWEMRVIPVIDNGQPSTMETMCRDELAVNLMLGGDEGFAISLAVSGFRISYGGRVFARCADAMVAAEAMMASTTDWTSCEAHGYSKAQIAALKAVMEAAERRGEIMLDKVYPQ